MPLCNLLICMQALHGELFYNGHVEAFYFYLLDTIYMFALKETFASYSDILLCGTPDAWLEKALVCMDILLIDHANCEKKAAATAMNLMFRYGGNPSLQYRMSRLAREELSHFEQVMRLMRKRNIQYGPLSASGYAEQLRKSIRTTEPERLTDTLIIGAIIEARSCERFASLAPRLETIDEELARYYKRLCKSEARHFHDYLTLALETAEENEIMDRISLFAEVDKKAILSEDSRFRFHSGIPAACSNM